MADWNPWYTTGTVAIANAGTTATGVGTNFHTAGVRAGDLITNAAMTAWAVVTAEPTTPTQLAITAWGGAALPAGSPYRILRISDADRLIGAHADLMAALVPNLTALGALDLAANKGIYATGLNTLGTYDLTPAARAILALAGSSGAKLPVVTGTGAAALRNVLGPVSQASGVPTGAIAGEVGSNANGWYLRHVSGLLINIITGVFDSTIVGTQNYPMASVGLSSPWAYGFAMPDINNGADHVAWRAAGPVVTAGGSGAAALRGTGGGSKVNVPVTIVTFNRWY